VSGPSSRPSAERQGAEEPEQTRITYRDNRRIDPETYEVREPRPAAAPPSGGEKSASASSSAEQASADNPGAAEQLALLELKATLAERTADLQRLQAEYVNYKRRVDRDRDVARKVTIEGVLKDFLPVLDDVRSAREHEELTGGFKAVAEEVERITTKYGLQTYGQKGEPFDPHIHEALLHAHADGIDGPTCVEILQPGYRIGDRILRPARVAVAEPEPEQPSAAADSSDAAAAATDESTVDSGADQPGVEPNAGGRPPEPPADQRAR
jgi:molecular chaperone GrpE